MQFLGPEKIRAIQISFIQGIGTVLQSASYSRLRYSRSPCNHVSNPIKTKEALVHDHIPYV